MSVKVTVLDANQALSAHQVEQGGVLVLQAQNNVNYQLTDQATGFGPQNIITKRQGDDLVIMLDDGNLEPDIVIENYYDQEGAQIIGLHENGNLYAYVPQSGEVSQSISLLAEEVMASQALGGTELAVPFWAFNPWWLSGAGAVLALAGVVAAAGGGSKNSGGQDNTPPSAPKVESVQHTGTNSSFVKGTAEPNTTVYIRDAQGVVIGEGKTDANGNFEITTTRAVTTDDKLVVTAKDGAGRESSEFELNTNTATNESNVVPSVSNTKNNIENGAIVSTTLTVKASPNTLVEVRDTQGNVIGRGYTDASGNVEITTTTPLMAQPYNVVALSPLGKESQPAEVTGDTTAPSRPTATLENNFEERTGEDGNTVKTIVSANVVGKADPKATVKLLDANGNPVKDENNNDITTMADEDGTYSFKNLPALPHGQNYTVIAEDASGLPSPNAKAVSDHLEPKSPIVTGVVNGVNDAGQPITTISGVGEKEGDLIDILDNDGNLITTVKVNRDLSFSAVVPPMKTGDNFSVIEKDSAQNVSKPVSAKGNTEQVEAPSLNLIENEHGGLTAEGYAAPGATVSVVFPNGETRTVKADETGFYSIVDFVPQKAGDTAKVSASQVNVFGNSSPSTEKTYAKDQRAPEVELNETTYGKNEDAQPTQTISGKTEIGATVLLKGSDGSVVPATVNEKGEFEATLPAKDKDGNPITYVVEASDINSSKAEEKVVADNETDAPQFTVSQAEDGKLVVSQKAGTAVEPNAMVEVTFPDGTTQTVQANEEGKFEPVQSEKAQKAGANQTVSAKATDDKGNSSSMPDAVTVEVAEPKVVAQKAVLDDSNAPESNELTIEAQPEIPFIVTDAQGNEIGRGQTGKDGKQVITTTRPLQEGEEIKVIALDPQDPTNEEKQKTTTLKTDTNAPSEPSIEFVQNDDGTVTARVGNNPQANEPGSTIEVTFPDGTKGSAVVKADGTFDPITSAQPQPNGDAKATQIDEANNSSEPVTENYQDKKEPVAPSVNSEATLPNGNSEIRGTAEPNSTVTLKDKDGKVLGQAKADDKGNFVIESNEPLMDGADYQVTATDANGNESPKADVTADTKVNEPSVEITENSDGTLTVSPKLGTDGTPLKDENGQPLNEPGSTIDVTFPDGTIGKAVVNPDGSFAPIVSEKPQTSGELSVTATDEKGNSSKTTEEYADKKEPTAPQISENKNNQNEFGEPESTTVTGTAEPNSVVSIIDPATGEVLGEGKADKDGNFVITTNKALEDKPYDVKATDEAGNSSAPTEVKGDTDVPNKPSISFKQDENGIITATVGDNPQANEPGSIIEVTFPDGSKGSAVVKADGTFDPIMSEQPQIRGGEASAVAKDEQGNSSDPDVAIFEDKIKPALPHVDSVKNNHHDNTTTLSGNAEPGALVELKDEKGNLIGAVQADDKGDFTLVVPTLEHGAPFTLTAKDENNNTSDAIPVVGDTVAPKSPAPTVESIVAGQDENGKPITVLKGKVEGAEKGTKVTVTDPNTNEVLGTAETDENGEFTLETIKPLDNSLNYPLTAIDSYNNASQPTPVTTDLDKDGVTNEEEAQAKADIEKALETAKTAEEEYKKALEDAGNAIDQGEKEKLDALAKVAEEAKKAVQDLIDNLPKTTGNTEADQAYAKEQQDKLDELNSDVPVANDADGDDISDETEANAKQAVEKAVEKAQKAKETYDQALKDAGNAISDEEKAELDKLAKAVEDAKKDAQDLIDALPTSIGDKAGDQAFAEEQKTALGAVETPVVPAANDADSDDISNEAEETAKQAVEQAVTDAVAKAQAALETYETEKAKMGNAISDEEKAKLDELAKAVEDAKKDAQALIDNLPTTIGNTEGDQAYKAEQQAKLDAVKADVPAANDADSDDISNEAEETAKQAVEQAVTDAVAKAQAALETYETEKAKMGNAISDEEKAKLDELAKAVEDAKKDAQALIDNLPTTIGNTEGDQAYKAEQQAKLDAVKADVPAANDADSDDISNEAEETAKQAVEQAVTNAVANAQTALATYEAEKAKMGNAISDEEKAKLDELAKAVEDAKKDAQALIDNLPTTIGNTEGDQAYKAEQQAKLDAVKADVPAANDADSDDISNEAEETAKQAVEQAVADAVAKAQAALETYETEKAKMGNAISDEEKAKLDELAKAVEDAKKDAQALIDNLPTTIGNTEGDQAYKAEQQAKLDAVKADVPAANDADSDDISNEAEETAKQAVEQAVADAVAKAQAALETYETEKAKMGNAISDEEKAKLDELAKAVEDAKKDAQALIDNLPTTIGNTEGDQAYKAEQQAKLDAVKADVPAANDADSDDISNEAEETAKQAVEQAVTDAVAKAQAALETYETEKAKMGNAISDEEKAKLDELAKAVEDAKKDAQALIDNLPTTIGNTEGDQAYKAEQQAKLDAVKADVPAANDADSDDISNEAEETAKQAVEQAVTDAVAKAQAALETYETEKAKMGNAISDEEKAKLDELAKAVEDAKKDAQALIDNLPTTIGNTEGDQAYKAEQQAKLDAVKADVPAANDADSDDISNEAEETAKQAVEQAVTNAVANAQTALATYEAEKAKMGNAISDEEKAKLDELAKAVEDAKKDAQALIDNLPTTIGNTEGDQAYKAEQQAKLDAVKADVPAANDADSDDISNEAEETAKQAVEQAVADAVAKAQAALETYETEKAKMGNAISDEEKAKLDELAKAVEDAKKDAQALIDNLPTTIGNTEGDQAYKAEQQAKLDAVKADVPAANDADSDDISNEAEETAKQAVEQAVADAVAKAQAALETYETEKAKMGNAISDEEKAKLDELAKAVEDAKKDAQALIDNLPTTIGNTEGDQAYKAEQQAKLDAVKADVPAANDADSDDISDNAENTAKSEIQQKVQEAQNALKAYNDYLNGTALSNTAPNKGEVINLTEAAELARLKGDLEQKLQDAQNALNNNWPTQVGTTESDNTDKQQLTNALGGITVPQDRPANDVNDNGIADDQDYINANTAYTQALADVNAINEKIRALTAENADDATKALTPAEREALVNEANAAQAKLNTAKDALAKVPNSYANPTNADETYAKLNEKVSALAVLEVPQANSTAGVKPDEQLVQEAQTELASAKAKVDEINRKLAETPIINANNKPALDQEAAAAQQALNDAKAKIGALPTTTLPTNKTDKADLTTEANKLTVNPVVSNDDDNDNISNSAEQQAISTAEQKVQAAVNAKTEYDRAKTAAEADGVISQAEARDLETKATTLNNAIRDAKPAVEGLSPAQIGSTPADVSKEAELNGRIPETVVAPPTNDTDNDGVSDAAEAETLKNLGLTAEAPNKDKVTQAEEAKQAYDTYLTKAQTSGGAAPNDKATLNNDELAELARLKADYETKRTAAQDAVTGLAGKLGNSTEDSTTTQKGFQDRLDRLGDIELPKTIKPETSFNLASDPYQPTTLGQMTASVDNDTSLPQDSTWAVSYFSKAQNARVTLNLTKGASGWALDAGQTAETGVTVNANGTIVFDKGSLKDAEEMTSLVTVGSESDTAVTRAPITGESVKGVPTDWTLYDGDESGTTNYDDVIILEKQLDRQGATGKGTLNLGRGEDKLVIGIQGQDLSKNDTGLSNFNVDMGEGDDTVVIYDKILNSTVDLGEGNNRITIGTVHGDVARSSGESQILAGAGNDRLEFVTESRDGNRHRTGINGSARINLGDGENVVDTSKAQTGVNFRSEVTTGSGNDTFDFRNAILQPAAPSNDGSTAPGYLRSGDGADVVRLGGTGSLVNQTPPRGERIDAEVNKGHGVDLGKGDDTLFLDPVLTPLMSSGRGILTSFIGTYETGELKGGEGFDRLVVDFNTQQLNAERKLTGGRGHHANDEFKLNLYLVSGFEEIDMSHDGKHTLNNVIALNQATRVQYVTPPNGVALAQNQGTISGTDKTGLLVKGTEEDKVDLAGRGNELKQADTLNHGGVIYDHYEFQGNHIYIQQGIQII